MDCPDEDSDLCLEVCFETETDIAELDQKFDGDFSNYEGYFMNSGARVFASTPEFNNRMISGNTKLDVSLDMDFFNGGPELVRFLSKNKHSNQFL